MIRWSIGRAFPSRDVLRFYFRWLFCIPDVRICIICQARYIHQSIDHSDRKTLTRIRSNLSYYYLNVLPNCNLRSLIRNAIAFAVISVSYINLRFARPLCQLRETIWPVFSSNRPLQAISRPKPFECQNNFRVKWPQVPLFDYICKVHVGCQKWEKYLQTANNCLI